MTTFTITDYDTMNDDQFLFRNRENCELDLSPEQREEMAGELDAWSSDRGEAPFSQTLSNAHLYEHLRMNGIPFSRFRTYTLEELDAVSEDAFWCMFPWRSSASPFPTSSARR